MSRRTLASILALLLLGGLTLGQTPARAAPPGQTQPPLCFFQIMSTDWRTGYYVCDDTITFRSAYYRWGIDLGTPISQRYIKDGYVMQAFQKGIMQWRPELLRAVPVNIFDDLHNAGYDAQLLARRQIPPQLPPGWDGYVTSFDEVVRKRQALLNARSAFRRAYFSVRDPMTIFGLPTSEITDMGSHYAIRLQRAALQEWKEDVPWARRGQVTIVNGGEIAREFGLIPEPALGQVRTPYIPQVQGAPTVPGVPSYPVGNQVAPELAPLPPPINVPAPSVPTYPQPSVPAPVIPTAVIQPPAPPPPPPVDPGGMPGQNIRCQTQGLVEICASVSNANPAQSTNVTVYGRLRASGVGQGGRQMETTWFYRTTTSSCSGTTDGNGLAQCTRDISGATSGTRVNVTVTIGSYAVTTSFTPR